MLHLVSSLLASSPRAVGSGDRFIGFLSRLHPFLHNGSHSIRLAAVEALTTLFMQSDDIVSVPWSVDEVVVLLCHVFLR